MKQTNIEKLIEWMDNLPYSKEIGIYKDILAKAKQLQQEEPSGWTSVEDRLPEDSVDVLMCYWAGTVPIIYTGYIAGDYNAWHFGEEGENVGTTIITHWMPLPTPPLPNKPKQQ